MATERATRGESVAAAAAAVASMAVGTVGTAVGGPALAPAPAPDHPTAIGAGTARTRGTWTGGGVAAGVVAAEAAAVAAAGANSVGLRGRSGYVAGVATIPGTPPGMSRTIMRGATETTSTPGRTRGRRNKTKT